MCLCSHCAGVGGRARLNSLPLAHAHTRKKRKKMAACVSPLLRSSFRICSPLTIPHHRCRTKPRTPRRKCWSQRRHVHQTASRYNGIGRRLVPVSSRNCAGQVRSSRCAGREACAPSRAGGRLIDSGARRLPPRRLGCFLLIDLFRGRHPPSLLPHPVPHSNMAARSCGPVMSSVVVKTVPNRDPTPCQSSEVETRLRAFY